MAAWCESREDFRVFRLDRIRGLQMGEEKFEEVSLRPQSILPEALW